MNVAIKETLVCDLRSAVPTKLSNNSWKSLLSNYNPWGNHLCFDLFKTPAASVMAWRSGDWADGSCCDAQVDWKSAQSATWRIQTIRHSRFMNVHMHGCVCAMPIWKLCDSIGAQAVCLQDECMQLCLVCVCVSGQRPVLLCAIKE